MIGMLLLGIIAVYIAVAVFVVTRARTRRIRIALVILMVVLPFIERTLATVRFQWLCHSEHGIQLRGPIGPVRSIETAKWGEAKALLDEFDSLERVYVVEQGGEFVELQRNSKRLPIRSNVSRSSAAFRILEVEQRDLLNINRSTVSLAEKDSGRIVAIATNVEYYGDFLVRALSGGPAYPERRCARRFGADDLLRAIITQTPHTTESERNQ